MATRVAKGLNHRFQQGTPSGSVGKAGVVVRAFDRYTQGPALHWLPGNHSSYDVATWSASLISARYPFVYSKTTDGGFVLEATAAAECMQCAYERDAHTAGLSPSCRRAARARHSVHATKVAPSQQAVCIPGCVADGCQLTRGYRCNASEGRAKQLRFTLEAQVRRAQFSYDAIERLPVKRGGLHYHNEFIFNASCLRARLPHSVVAVVRNVHPFYPFTHEGCNVSREARAVHRNFLAAWNVTAVSVPLLDMNLSDAARPFRPARLHLQPATPQYPLLMHNHQSKWC